MNGIAEIATAPSVIHGQLDLPLQTLLTSGGDSRTATAPDTLENPYGCSPVPRAEVLELGSCTGSSIGSHGYRAARSALCCLRQRVTNGESLARLLHGGFAAIREEIADALVGHRSPGVEVVLSPSGTDAELIALVLAHGDRSRDLVNIVVGPSEVGSGTPLAAAGKYFDAVTPTGEPRTAGAPVDEALAALTRVESVWLRHPDGATRDESEIDREVSEMVEREIGAGRRVLLHLVAHSKTGVHAPSIDTVTSLSRRYPQELAVMVDAAQGRFSRRGLTEVLDKGFLVLITGSKFYGGPSFSGALLVPRSWSPERRGVPSLSPGMRDFFTLGQLPERWETLSRGLRPAHNLGLLLRWEAALEEIRRYYLTSPSARLEVLRAYERLVPEVFAGSDHIQLDSVSPPILADSTNRLLESKTTVFTFTLHTGGVDSRALTFDELKQVFHLLNQDLSRAWAMTTGDAPRLLAERYHVGQPVCLGRDRTEGPSALRAALGGVLLSTVASDCTWGETLDERLVRLGSRLTGLRNKLDLIAGNFQRFADPGAVARE